MQHALQRAQALGIAPQAESQQQHLSLPPRVLKLQQYGSGAGDFSAFVLLPAPKSLPYALQASYNAYRTTHCFLLDGMLEGTLVSALVSNFAWYCR